MATNSLEILGKTVKFDSLSHLRDELGKNTQNKERLGEFEKTIDEALKEGEKQGFIEFTRDEWESLITKDKLPPLEIQKKLLKEKIEKRTQITEGTKEEKKGFMSDMKNNITQKVDGIKDSATEKVKALKEKAEKIKQYSKPGLLFLGIGLSLKLWGYKLGNWFSGLFGKKGEYDSKIKEIEMEKEFLANPEEALKKYGAEAKEKFEAGKEGVLEKGKEVISKVPALAAISAVAVSIYAVAKKFLPKSVTDKITDEKDGASILKVLKGRKFLKLFGAGGLALLGAGGLFYYFSENPDKLKSLGNMPEDTEGKKSWWKKALGVAGIGENEEGHHVLSYLNGEKIEEELEQKPLEEGKVWLKDHPMITNVEKKIEEFGDKILRMYRENPAAYNLLAITLGTALGGKFVIKTGAKAIEVGKDVLFGLGKSAKNHPLLWSMGIIGGLSGLSALRFMQVKEDASVEDIEDFAKNVLDYDDFKNNNSWIPDGIEPEFDKIAVCLKGGAKILCDDLDDMINNIWDTAGGAVKEFLTLDTRERIDTKNHEGLALFQSDLRAKKENIEYAENLIGEDGKGGIVQELLKKTEKHEKLSEADIHKLMAATKGTNIRIFPEGGDKETGHTVQWIKIDKDGQPLGMPRNVCLNPALSETTQAEASRDFDPHPYEGDKFMKSLGESYEGIRNLISDIAEAVTSNDTEKTKGLSEKFLALGGVLGQAGTNLLIKFGEATIFVPVTLPGMWIQNIIPGGKEYSVQEQISAYGATIVPVVLVGVGKNFLLGGGEGGLLRTIAYAPAYPFTSAFKAGKIGVGVYQRFQKGDLAGIIRDPINSITQRGVGVLEKRFGKLPFTGEMKLVGQLKEVNGLLLKMKWEQEMGLKNESKNTAKRIAQLLTGESKIKDLLGFKSTALAEIVDKDIAGHLQKIDELLRGKKEFGTLNMTDTQRNELADSISQKELERSQAKAEKSFKTKNTLTIQDIEAKKQEILSRQEKELDALVKKHGNNAKADPEFAKLAARNQATITELEHLAANIKAKNLGEAIPHNINLKALHDVKIRGKGIAMLVGALGGAYVISKTVEAIKGPDSGSYRDKSAQEILTESTPEEDGIDYFGYGIEEEKVNTEAGNTHCETLAEFESYEKKMEEEYGADFSGLFEKMNQKNATIEDINKICEEHEKRVQLMQKLLGNNKKLLTEFWNKKFPQDGSIDNILPEDLQKQGIKAFMAIFRRGGKFELEYMDKQDMKNILVRIKESTETSTTEKLVDGGIRVLPVIGSAMSGVDAVKDFKNGDIKSGFWNVGWCVGGFILDAASLVSGGATGAAGVALRTAKVATVATNVALHTGVMLAGQGVQEYFDNARSEIINIDTIPESQ